jgi:hypothetical protein
MPANPQVTDEIAAISAWLREPDYAEEFSLVDMAEWVNRRPLAAIGKITAALDDYVVGWRDIESAPEERALFGYRNQFGGWHSQTFDGPWEPRKYGYTHWMPLPASPLVSQEG